ncbi:MAG TPA: RNA polymerase sigma factor [Mobilitalea sp.]|nr:RNA polymerase sigma factor [Mobilitalea sp.]
MGKEFDKIYDNNKNAIYSYLYYMSKDVEDAEDLCQETFLKIYRNLKSFRDNSNERAWCITIARNTFLTWIRKKKLKFADGEDIDQIPSEGSNSPEARIIRQEESKLIKTVLLQLKEEYRTVLLLRDFEELSYKEIGIITGLSESAVKIRIFRAREKYKQLYQSETIE